MTLSFPEMSVEQIKSGLMAKEFTAKEITTNTIERIESCNKSVHAFLELTPQLAMEKAQEIDAAINDGKTLDLPLLGVPVAFKDNMNLAGTHTTCSSRMLENYVSPFTATCVEKTIQAGALPMGKLNMDEFAFGSSTETSAFGPTYNPWDLQRVPGGSSGGSAAAVASGMATATLGSDTGGSIRQPGSFCGAVAVKPSYGMVSRHGVVAFGSSLDQVGPFTRSVKDAAYVLNAITGLDPHDCTSQDFGVDFTRYIDTDIKGMKIGIVPAFMEAEGLEGEVREKIEEVATKLQSLGAELVEIDLPAARNAIGAYYVLGPCEAFSNLARFDSVRYGYCDKDAKNLEQRYSKSRSEGFGPETRRRIMLGSYLLSAGQYEKYYYPAQQIRTLITNDYVEAFKKCDCILAPASPRTAFKFGEITDPTAMYLSDMFTVSVNIAGNGGMSLPVGKGRVTNLPVGAQLISPQFKDQNMIRVASALEGLYGVAPVADAFADGKVGA